MFEVDVGAIFMIILSVLNCSRLLQISCSYYLTKAVGVEVVRSDTRLPVSSSIDTLSN